MEIDNLISSLAVWQRPDTGFDSPSAREVAIERLRSMGPEVVPVLAGRLEALIDETRGVRERRQAVMAAWTAWYNQSYSLMPEGETLDTPAAPSAADDRYRDPHELKNGIIEALHRIGDQRAAPALVAALADPACIASAADALCDIGADIDSDDLLTSVALVHDNPISKKSVKRALAAYGVTRSQGRDRLASEVSPRGRVNLVQLAPDMIDDGTPLPTLENCRDALVVLCFEGNTGTARSSSDQLDRLDGRSSVFSHDPDEIPDEAVTRAAIALAAADRPTQRDAAELRSALHRKATTARARHAVEAAIVAASSSPPPPAELSLTLDLARNLTSTRLRAPLVTIQALHQLATRPGAVEHVTALLHRNGRGLLFPLMCEDDIPIRDESRALFELIASLDMRRDFAEYSTPPSLWRRIGMRVFGR